MTTARTDPLDLLHDVTERTSRHLARRDGRLVAPAPGAVRALAALFKPLSARPCDPGDPACVDAPGGPAEPR